MLLVPALGACLSSPKASSQPPPDPDDAGPMADANPVTDVTTGQGAVKPDRVDEGMQQVAVMVAGTFEGDEVITFEAAYGGNSLDLNCGNDLTHVNAETTLAARTMCIPPISMYGDDGSLPETLEVRVLVDGVAVIDPETDEEDTIAVRGLPQLTDISSLDSAALYSHIELDNFLTFETRATERLRLRSTGQLRVGGMGVVSDIVVRGHAGGLGAEGETPAAAGNGDGGGCAGDDTYTGKAAGHATVQESVDPSCGSSYGSIDLDLDPLVGSGGGGGGLASIDSAGGRGGLGGGAIVLEAPYIEFAGNVAINVSGCTGRFSNNSLAMGDTDCTTGVGTAAVDVCPGGAGSGGSIWLRATRRLSFAPQATLELEAVGGPANEDHSCTGSNLEGAPGRIRVDAIDDPPGSFGAKPEAHRGPRIGLPQLIDTSIVLATTCSEVSLQYETMAEAFVFVDGELLGPLDGVSTAGDHLVSVDLQEEGLHKVCACTRGDDVVPDRHCNCVGVACLEVP